MDDECIARGIYSFEKGDQVRVSPWAVKSKYFQEEFSLSDSHAIFESIAQVTEVHPTGHVEVFFTSEGRTEKCADDEIAGQQYPVVPEAIYKVPLLKEGDLVKLQDTSDDENLEPGKSVAEILEDMPKVLDDEEDPTEALVENDGESKTHHRLAMDFIARPARDDFRATLTKASTSEPLAKKWFQDMQDSMQDLPDANMTPDSMPSRHAPGDAVKVSEPIASEIQIFEENSRASKKSVLPEFLSSWKAAKEDQAKKSLLHVGKVLQVNTSGYTVVLFPDGYVWYVQSSLLERVESSEDSSQGESPGCSDVLSKKVDSLIIYTLGLKKVELLKGCLHAACFSGSTPLLSLIMKDGLGLECEDRYGNKPLHYAAHGNQPEMINHLLSLGANINATNNRRHTALQFAVKEGVLGCVRQLTKHQNTLDPNVQDDIGNTALHVAIANANVEIFDELFQLPNVDFALKNKYGLNALHMAALKGDAKLNVGPRTAQDTVVVDYDASA